MSNQASQASLREAEWKSTLQTFLMNISNCSRLSYDTKITILETIAHNSTEKEVYAIARKYGVSRFLPLRATHEEIPLAEKVIALRELAPSVFNYLPPATPICLHNSGTLGTSCASGAVYLTLFIGPHTPRSECMPIPLASGKAIASRVLSNSTFGLLINGFALREVLTYTDGSIAAVCYGQDRIFWLRRASHVLHASGDNS